MAFLLFITAFILSGIAAYYSVIGLIAIFAAAAIPVAVMGGSLEVAKLVVASWLYRYWKHIPFLMKSYFTTALLVLMIVTSMGIFGFLSKAHIEQGVVTGDFVAKIALIDEKIKIERDNIENARAVIKQLDDAVNGINAKGSDREIKLRDGSTYTRSAAEQALQVRRSQAKDRASLTKQIEAAQNNIIKLQQEAAPLRAESRKIEAEVGPIKYVAAMIYGDNPDQNMLEASVRWLIILLICVFDPLAVLMLIAANLTQLKTAEWKRVESTTPDAVVNVPEEIQPDNKIEDERQPVKNEEKSEPEFNVDDHTYLKSPFSQFTQGLPQPVIKENQTPEYLKKKWKGFTPGRPQPTVNDEQVKPIEEVPVNNAQYKLIPDEYIMPVSAQAEEPKYEQDTSALTEEQIAQIKETVKESKKKVKKVKENISPPIEQTKEDKSIEQSGIIGKPIVVDEQVQEMIDSGDQQGLEQVYKKIVKELTKNNRAKSTHWGPIKNTKNG